MKILTQDKKNIIEVPKEIWVTNVYGDVYTIVGRSYTTPYYGTYQTEERAKIVLNDIYKAIRDGKHAYEMPVE